MINLVRVNAPTNRDDDPAFDEDDDEEEGEDSASELETSIASAADK
jgi:hypothetical protein